MKISGYTYAVMHVLVHVIIAGLLYFAVQPDLATDYVKLAIIIVGTAVADLDHIPLWIERGIKGYLELRSIEEFGIPRKYPLHNLMILLGTIGGSILIVVKPYFLIGLFFSAVSLHLLWDLVEDLAIFKMGYRHWL